MNSAGNLLFNLSIPLLLERKMLLDKTGTINLLQCHISQVLWCNASFGHHMKEIKFTGHDGRFIALIFHPLLPLTLSFTSSQSDSVQNAALWWTEHYALSGGRWIRKLISCLLLFITAPEKWLYASQYTLFIHTELLVHTTYLQFYK